MLTTMDCTVPSGQRSMQGYIARPKSWQGSGPGLIVIHDIRGFTPHTRDMTELYARQGYVALAVDLFGIDLGDDLITGVKRSVCLMNFFLRRIAQTLDPPDYIRLKEVNDLQNALTYLQSVPGVDPNRIGAVGFCSGGNFALAWACTDPRVKVVAPFYAFNPQPMAAIRRACPIVASYPEQDQFLSHVSGHRLETAVQRYHIPNDIKYYPETRHSFCDARMPAAYDEHAAQDALKRVVRFFTEHGLAPQRQSIRSPRHQRSRAAESSY